MLSTCIGILIFVYSVVANNGLISHCEKVEMSATLPHSLTGISHNIGRDNLMPPFIDLTNQKFGRLTVIKRVANYRRSHGRDYVRWLCRCNCGNYFFAVTPDLRCGGIVSCGKHRGGALNVVHGYCRNDNVHPLYNIYVSMRKRCYQKTNKSYKYYGAQDIIICDEWLQNPKAFIEWGLENGWENGLTIDRIDNYKGYDPDNCRFVTMADNLRNKKLLSKANTSGYRGVSKSKKRYLAVIRYDGVNHRLGLFDSPKLAALRYDVEAFKLNDGRPMNFVEKVG